MNGKHYDAVRNNICQKYSLELFPAPTCSKLGITDNVAQGILPIDKLRHPPISDSSGWYVWAGEELSGEPNFFKPIHIEYLKEKCPGIQKFLGLMLDWRFPVTNECENVWFDPALLEVS